MSNNLRKIWLIGAGSNAVEYAKVLNDLKENYVVIGRGENSALNFENITGIPVKKNGLKSWLNTNPEIPDFAIISVNIEELVEMGLLLLSYGVKKILVEKPAGLNYTEIKALFDLTVEKKAEVFVAYNRRFYSSVLKAGEMINNDGGITSFYFEFTEWLHRLKEMEIPDQLKKFWFYANSTHVVDLAFYLGGRPVDMNSFTKKSTIWPCNAIFSGAGITVNNVLFSYFANWEAPGRWGLEVLTHKHKFIFRPLEKLQIQKLGSVVVDEVEIDDEFDKKYKPGFFKQTEAFLNDNHKGLASVHEHIQNFEFYEKINSGSH